MRRRQRQVVLAFTIVGARAILRWLSLEACSVPRMEDEDGGVSTRGIQIEGRPWWIVVPW